MEWTGELEVGLPAIDEDHRAFVEGLNAASTASDAEFPARFAALAAHTQEHFAHEEEIMAATGFFAIEMHKAEHRRVLAEAQQVAARLAAGDLAAARAYVVEVLPEWFLNHRNTMDLVTAMFAKQQGYR